MPYLMLALPWANPRIQWEGHNCPGCRSFGPSIPAGNESQCHSPSPNLGPSEDLATKGVMPGPARDLQELEPAKLGFDWLVPRWDHLPIFNHHAHGSWTVARLEHSKPGA